MISTYQIRNVLRVYGNDLKKKAMIVQDEGGDKKQSSDSISISDEARDKAMLNRISDNIVSQITKNDYHSGNID